MDETGVLFDILFIVFRDRSQCRLGAVGGHGLRWGHSSCYISDNEHEHGHVRVAGPEHFMRMSVPWPGAEAVTRPCMAWGTRQRLGRTGAMTWMTQE